MARHFANILFLGGEEEYTKVKIKFLHELIDKGLNISGGLQQPGHPDSEEAWQRELEWRAIYEEECKDIVRDLAMALTGEEIKFVECGDALDSGETYWCHRCQECNRFKEEYDAFCRLHDGDIDREEYIRQADQIKHRYESD